MENVVLNNGIEMPLLGLGTWPFKGADLKRVLHSAYEIGYRSFDTAWLYKNEHDIGEFLSSRNIDRNQCFITSKLHIDDLYFCGYHRKFHLRYKGVKSAFRDSCRRLNTDYIDLYLLHWPFPGWQYMWEDLVELYNSGYIRAIGVSSFSESHIEELKKISGILPAVNQFEISPLNTRKELIKYCQENGIRVEAYSPFGRGKGTISIMEDNRLITLSAKYEKSVAQIVLRWFIQQGIIAIPRTDKVHKLQENIDIFDFILSDEDMAVVDSLNKNAFFGHVPQK